MNRVYKWYLRMHRSNSKLIKRLIEIYLRIIFSCDIPSEVEIGENCRFGHNALGVVIGPNVVIGKNCRIGHNVTIGGRNGNPRVPIIGDNVLIGAGSIILGDITIGDNSKIGAGTVVVKNVPANTTVISGGGILFYDTNKKQDN